MKRYLQEAAIKGGAAAKQNMIPGIILQVIAFSLILSYYQLDGFREKLDVLGRWNVELTPWFAIVMTMVFGGIIPLLVESLQLRTKGKPQRPTMQIIFTLVLWGMQGALTDWFYSLQATIFGSELEFWTVFKKVCVDQFVWVPLYVVPAFTLLLLWRDKSFSLTETKAALARKGFIARALPLMISNWAIWIPAVTIVYAFPLALQMILMNLILVFWSLILTIFIAD